MDRPAGLPTSTHEARSDFRFPTSNFLTMSQETGLTSNLKKLVAVRKGDNVRRVASSDRINAIQETLKALVRGDNVVAGENLRKKKGEGFFILSGNRGGRGGGFVDIETPFQVVQVTRAPEDMGVGDLVGVISNSHLFNSEDRDTYEEDNSDWGLLEDDRPPSDANAWADNYLGDKIWLQIELDEDQAIIAIDIMHGPVGSGQWDTYPNPIELNDDDPGNVYQQFYHQIIAEVTDPEEDPRPGLFVKNDADQEVQITQCLFTNLMMTTAHTTRDSVYPDVPLIVPVPWNLPGTATDGSADEINDVTSPDPPGDPVTPWAYGPTSGNATPFRVIPTPQNGDDAIGVISNSHLFNSEDRNTYEEDNSDWGLLSDDETTGSFAAPSIGDKIWLKITLDPDDQSITAIDIEYGTAWDGYPDPVNINTADPDNPYQEFFYQIIAEVTDPEQDPRPGFVVGEPGSPRQITQLLFANLMMTTAHTSNDADEPGLPLLVAIPWTVLPGTDTGGNADEIPPEDDLMTPWQLGDQETRNDYDFELFNASELGLPKVLVLDGVVYGPNNADPVDPSGMPSDDTYTLDVADEDEIWVEIDYDASSHRILSASLANGAVTPDDTEGVAYITIGHVAVDDSGDVPIVTCRNEICGDIFWQPDRKDNDYNFEMFDASDGDGAKVLLLDGVVYGPNNDGGVDPDGMPSDDSFIIDGISDEDEIWLQINWSEDSTIIESVSIEWGPSTPDDTATETHITIGNVQIDAGGDVTIVNCRNELCGDAVIEIPPAQDVDPEEVDELILAQDTDDGTIRWIETCSATCGAGSGAIDGGGA